MKNLNKITRSPLDECDHNECDHVCEMKRSKHTKGPWKIWANTERTERRITDSSNLVIAEVYSELISSSEPNARLIAAAPDLLRELRSAIFYIETYGGDVTSNFAAGGNLEAVNAIIAKAEGRES